MTRSSRIDIWQEAWPLVRDIAIFVIGTIGILAELGAWLIVNRTPDPSLLVAFTAALGLPIFLRKE